MAVASGQMGLCSISTADEVGLSIRVLRRPGSSVAYDTVLAEVGGSASGDHSANIRDSFFVGDDRTFEYDPGTATDVISSQTRLLGDWVKAPMGDEDSLQFSRVSVAPLVPAELMEEAFGPISRYASSSVDVTLALVRGLHTLAAASSADFPVRRAETRTRNPGSSRRFGPDFSEVVVLSPEGIG